MHFTTKKKGQTIGYISTKTFKIITVLERSALYINYISHIYSKKTFKIITVLERSALYINYISHIYSKKTHTKTLTHLAYIANAKKLCHAKQHSQFSKCVRRVP